MQSTSLTTNLIVIALGLILMGVGAVAFWLALVFNWEASRQVSWKGVSATLTNEASKAGRLRSSEVTYRYSVDERDFNGQGVAGSFVSGDRVNARLDELKTAVKKAEPVTIWVNPDSPGESTLLEPGADRLPYFAIIGLPALLLGIAILSGLGVLLNNESETRRDENPNDPSQWREDWQNGFCRKKCINPFLLSLSALLFVLVSFGWTTINHYVYNDPFRATGLLVCLFAIIPVIWCYGSLRSYRATEPLRIVFKDGLVMGKTNRIEIQSEVGTLPKGIDWKLKHRENHHRTGSGRQNITVTHSVDDLKLVEQISPLHAIMEVTISLGEKTTSVGTELGHTWLLEGKKWPINVGPFEVPVL